MNRVNGDYNTVGSVCLFLARFYTILSINFWMELISLKGYTLFFRFGDQCSEYSLRTMSDRQLEVSLVRLGIPGAINVEVWDDDWVILENSYFNLYEQVRGNNAEMTPEAKISDNKIFYLVTKDGSIKLTVSAYETTQEFVNYGKYKLRGLSSILVGSATNCQITMKDRFVASQHAQISLREDGIFIQDTSQTGTYINGKRITEVTQIQIFDEVLIGNSKLIFMPDVVAINNLDKNVVNLNPLTAFDVADLSNIEIDSDNFSRAPRVLLPLDTEAVTVEAPPSKKNTDEMPWIFSIGPTLTMPMPMIMSAIVNMSVNGRGAKSYIGIMISMLMSAGLGLMWNTLRTRYKKKKDAADEAFRREQYTKYIEQNREYLQEKVDYNSDILRSQYLATQPLLLSLNDHRENIWNRNVNHSDFLTVYLGTGVFKTPFEIKVPEERFSLTQDDLLELPHELHDNFEFIEGQPSLLNLKEHKILGVIGLYPMVHTVTRNILSQIAALHSYTDVKIVVVYKEEEGYLYDWVKWLPHTFTNDKKMRYVASTPETKERVLQVVGKDLSNRLNQATEKAGIRFPFEYVIVATSPEVFEGSTLGQCMTSDLDIGVHFILAYSSLDGIPNECKALVQCDKNFSGLLRLDAARDETSDVAFDNAPFAIHEWFSRKVSGLTIKEVASGEIPTMVDYLGSLGVGKLEQWDIRKKYKENRAYEGIKAFLGFGAGGKKMILDLHEKKYGPHGLVAGTTGSGKSETLQTAILSWMLNYSPEEVAFVLIDYKGGGMANAFLGEPHLAGTITNIPDDNETSSNTENSEGSEEESGGESLDSNQTRRALVAIKAEIKYRQAIFRDHKVNHIDNYMKLYRKGKATKPLPHLIIISDEFAELKKEQPEFIKELVSAARVGRSLGVHLILATQKPSNSVDDEIWANSRFKICLRVQDAADSNGMLHRPDAAFLTQTGRGYFQLGNNEIFEEFQSAYSGADYVPRNKIELAEDSFCKMIELDGTETPIEVEREQRPDDAKTQLEAGIAYVTAACKSLGIAPARQLWAPQLTKKIYLDDLTGVEEPNWKAGIYTCFGLIDDPEMQTQHLATFNFLTTNNIYIVGTQGFGKSTLLTTMLYSLIMHYSPDQVQFYIMDFSSKMLKVFKNSKHCGGYIDVDDDPEKVQRLYQSLDNICEQRKALFEQVGVGTYTEYVRVKPLHQILVVIDNVVMYYELYGENMTDKLIVSTRDYVKFGIQFIVSGSKTNDLKTKARNNFLGSVGINLAKSDCREIYGVGATFEPAPYRGRGLFLYGKRLLEYHIALATHGDSELERTEALTTSLQEYNKIYASSRRAVQIAVIPKDETFEEFFDKAKTSDKYEIPFGYNMADISFVYMSMRNIRNIGISTSVSAVNAIDFVFKNMLYAVKAMGFKYQYWQFDGMSKPSSSGFERDKVVHTEGKLSEAVVDYFNDTVGRYGEVYKKRQAGADFNYSEAHFDKLQVIFIDNLSKFIAFVETNKKYLKLMRERGMASLKEAAKKRGETEPSQVELTKFEQRMKMNENDIMRTFECSVQTGTLFVIGIDLDAQTAATARSVLYKNMLNGQNVIHFGGAFDAQRLLESRAVSAEKRKVRSKNEGWSVIQGQDKLYYMVGE